MLDSESSILREQKSHDSKPSEKISSDSVPQESFQAEHGEILLPVIDSANYQEPLEYAIKMAKILETGIILMYVTPRVRIPDAYLEYAMMERFYDYPASYYEEMSAEKIAPLRTRLKSARVKHKSFTYIGDLNDALRVFENNNNVVLIVIPGQINKGSLARRLFGGASFSVKLSGLKLPVLVVPNRQ